MPITDNNGSQFYNVNFNKSFLQTIPTGLTPLSAFVCSEVVVINRGANTVNFYDNNEFSDNNMFYLSAGESFIFKVAANSNSLSAKSVTGTSQINYRVSRFGSYPQG